MVPRPVTLAWPRAKGFIRLALQEFEGAMERAGEKLEAADEHAPPSTPAAPPNPE